MTIIAIVIKILTIVDSSIKANKKSSALTRTWVKELGGGRGKGREGVH